MILMISKENCSFLDTDIIQKVGGFRKEKLLRKILISFNFNLFIHKYLVDEELILKGSAREQFDQMISNGEISIMTTQDLNSDELDEYNLAISLLSKEMDVDLSKKRDKNAGEVKSMAMAYAKNFKFFISDDRGARVAANKHLQNLDGTVLETIRMKDIITHIKTNEKCLEIDRKTAKQLYLYATNPKIGRTDSEIEQLRRINILLKKDFDENLWPIT